MDCTHGGQEQGQQIEQEGEGRMREVSCCRTRRRMMLLFCRGKGADRQQKSVVARKRVS